MAVSALATFFLLPSFSIKADHFHNAEPIIIAHRGASGYRPEHTIMSYKLGIEQGADYIEPDLVVTKDGHFVARHDIYLSTTTNVASLPEFAGKKRTINGKSDWYVFDFTLEDLKKLKAVQPWSSRGQVYDGLETIPTLAEVVSLVSGMNADTGLYIELKQPALLERYAPDLRANLVSQLNAVTSVGIPVFFQCFDGNFIKSLYGKLDAPLIYLVGGTKDKRTGWYVLESPLDDYVGKIAGFGLNKALLLKPDGSDSGLLKTLQGQGALVHVWTVRDDSVPELFGNVQQELKFLFSRGVHGIFTDFPDTAIAVRKSFKLLRMPE